MHTSAVSGASECSQIVTGTHKIRELEHGTLQLIDPKNLLEMRIQDIEELQAGQEKLRNKLRSPSGLSTHAVRESPYMKRVQREKTKKKGSKAIYTHT